VLTGEAGRRVERYPGYPRSSRPLLRGGISWQAAHPTGSNRALYAALRAEQIRLGGDAIPAEELRFVGGSEGLRGHRDREFAGDRILAMTLEHRWITGPRGGRVFLFADGARHELSQAVEAGSARGIPGGGVALARTELSPGWDFGYGAGLRSPTPAGTVGVELGLEPGRPLREGKIHLRYSTDW
jgi:hemolysin activation/secretion protein